MILGENIGNVFSEGREIQQVYSYGRLVWEKESTDYSLLPFTIKALVDNVSIKLNDDDTGEDAVVFKYSINDGEYIETTTETTITINNNNRLTIIGADIYRCTITGLCDVCGNIMSVIYGDDFIGQTVMPYSIDGFFGRISGSLLSGGSDIRNAKNLILPATTLVNYCYRNMFYECHSLITAPKILPAMTLTRWCYDCMFFDCPNLRTAPELPATTLATKCYHDMFYECSKLTKAPELPATVMADECYSNMFYGCGLTKAPELPATTLAYECYYGMFTRCFNLTTAPELPATTLVNGCYRYMFADCNSLNYIKCYATGVETGYKIKDCIDYWTYSIESTGTLVCNRSYANTLKKYIPSTWTVEYFT